MRALQLKSKANDNRFSPRLCIYLNLEMILLYYIKNLGRDKANDINAAGMAQAVIEDAIMSGRALLFAEGLALIEAATIIDIRPIILLASDIDIVVALKAGGI